MYPLLASDDLAGLPITSLLLSTPFASIWKSAVSGQVEEDLVRRPSQVVYSVVPSVKRLSASTPWQSNQTTYGYRTGIATFRLIATSACLQKSNRAYLNVILRRIVSPNLPGTEHHDETTHPVDHGANVLVYLQVSSSAPHVGSEPGSDGCTAISAGSLHRYEIDDLRA